MIEGGTEQTVTVDRAVLEALVDVGKGDLERLVGEGYREGDDVVDNLVETVEEAEKSLQTAEAVVETEDGEWETTHELTPEGEGQ